MKTENKLSSQWYIFIGQSGSGKGTVSTIFQEFCNNSSISFLPVGTGDEIRSLIEKRTYMSQNIEKVNNVGFKQPAIIAGASWMMKIFNDLKEGQKIIQEGSPRSKEEFKMMLSLLETKPRYIESMEVIEIKAPDDDCRKRLVERTKKDKRVDLSVDGQHGVPDLGKINTKLSWWTQVRKDIVNLAKEKGVYRKIKNVGTPEELKKNVARMFAFA